MALMMAGLISNTAFAASKKAMRIDTRNGISVHVLFIQPDNPKAALILMPGGAGYLNLIGTTIQRNRGLIGQNVEDFVAQGFTVAAIDTPSDHDSGMQPRFRQSDDHLKDLEAVISTIKELTKLPIWMVGISRSTISVMHAALNSKAEINGLVVMSSVTRIPPRAGVVRLTNLQLDRIKIPALAIGHKGDGCRGTPPAGATQLANGMINSPKALAKIFTGGGNAGPNPCGPGSHHTFEGIQDDVVKFISEFIKSNLN